LNVFLDTKWNSISINAAVVGVPNFDWNIQTRVVVRVDVEGDYKWQQRLGIQINLSLTQLRHE